MKNIYILAIFTICFLSAQSQYMSRSQPVPFSCPTVCPGSVIVLDVPQVQNLNQGDTIQAWLSNASGSFASGTTTLSSTAYSLNTGTNWTNGAYLYSSNINDLYIKITIPAGLPAGSSYTIKMKTSSGFVANDLFSCSGSNYITVTSAYPTLGNQPMNAEGNDQWISHVYTWTATTSSLLTTTALVNAQDFFDSLNYKGYFLKDSLSFDINFNTASGGTCPGQPGTLNNGTNIPCSQGYATDFSLRMLRKQNFTPGTYQFTIDGDDGVRLSIDGGNTWLLSSYFEQLYSNGFKSTATAYPNGICLSGPTDLVLEFFQRNVDSRFTFTATALSTTPVINAGNQSTCINGSANFNLHDTTASSYQWYYTTNGGGSYNPVPNTAPFTGATTYNLNISPVPASYNNYLFYCSLGGICTNTVNTPTDTLFVFGQTSKLVYIRANKTLICPHNDSATLCVSVSGPNYSYLWNTGATTPCITTDTPGDFYASVSYLGACSDMTNHLQISIAPTITPVIQHSGNTLSVGAGSSYQWYSGNSAINGDTLSSMTISSPGTYYVTLNDTNGCPEQAASISVTSTGIDYISTQTTLNVYPNPATDRCRVTISGGELNKLPLMVYDELGRLVMQPITITHTADIDMHSLAGGVYLFKMGDMVRKVIKE